MSFWNMNRVKIYIWLVVKNLFLYHLDLYDEKSRLPFETLKHFFKVYFHGQPGSAELRNKLMSGKTTDDLRKIIETEFSVW